MLVYDNAFWNAMLRKTHAKVLCGNELSSLKFWEQLMLSDLINHAYYA